MSETFGQRLRRIRKAKKLTQRALASKLGIQHHCISQYELGNVDPTLARIEWLCKALGVTATELLGF